ncbi:ATP-binding protein [Chloroflexota bacterium]
MYTKMYVPINWGKVPKIEIDHTKCTVPMYCKLCLQACPQACFKVDEAEFKRGVEQNREKPGEYVLRADFRYNCTMCNVCVDICPVNAITITP